MRLGAIVLIFALPVACAKHPPPVEDGCIGAPGAKRAFVYLHGRDQTKPSEQELHNRDVLRKLAGELGARFAIARAETPCKDDPSELCWGWSFSDEELAKTAEVVNRAADKCFAPGTRFELLGFSNGGYAVDKLVARCKLHDLVPRATKATTVGAGMFHGPLADAPPDLSTCGDLTMISGMNDTWNFDPGDHYAKAMNQRGAHVRSIHAPNMGHALLFDPLSDAL